MPVWTSVPVKFWDVLGFTPSAHDYADGTTWRPGAIQQYTDEIVDIAPPVVGITAPVANSILSGVITLTGTVTTDAVSVVISAADIVLSTATITGTSWSITLNTSPIPNGNITFTATATDAAGNAAQVSRAYIVNNVVTGGDINGPYVEPTYTTGTTSTISGGTLIAPTDSRLVYGGTDGVEDPGTFPGEYRPQLIKGTTTNIPATTLTFNYSGQYFEIYYRTRMSQEELRINVNGKWKPQTTTAGYRSSLGSGARGYTRIDFGSAAARTIRIDFRCWLSGIVVPNTSFLTKASDPTFKVVGLGDSLGGGTNKGSGASSTDYTGISSYFMQSMQDLGWGKNAYNEAIGGSGFTVNGDGGGSGRYIDRTPLAVNARNPNVVLLDAHVLNDFLANRTTTQCRDALIAVLQSMRNALPNANIIVALTPLVPVLVTNLGSISAAVATIQSYNDPMRVVANTYDAFVIDPLDGNVYDTDGTLIGNPEGARWQMPTGQAYPSTYMVGDGVHPTRAGSYIFAAQTTAAIRLCVDESSWQGPKGEISAPVDTAPPTVPTLSSPSATSTTVTLVWTQATDPSGVAEYNVYLSGAKIGSSTTPTFTHSGLTASTSYGPYQVTAVDASPASNESVKSNQQTISTAAAPSDTTPPTVPTGLTLTPTDGGFVSSWNAATDPETGVVGYIVYINNIAKPMITMLTYTATGLTNGTAVPVAIAAVNNVGLTGPKTTTQTVTPQATASSPFQPTNVAVVPGSETLRITWDAPTGGNTPHHYDIYFGTTKVHEERVTSTIIDEVPNGFAVAVSVSAVDVSGTEGPKSITVTDRPYPASDLGAPVEVESYGPNGTHWADRTPWLRGTVAKTVDVACTWAAIKAAVNALTAAEVNAGVKIRVANGSLPGSGASSGSSNMMINVGQKFWRKRVLIVPAGGRGAVTFAGSVSLNKVFNCTFALFDMPQGQAFLFEGCSYSAYAWSSAGALRITGLGGTNTTTGAPTEVHTEGFDSVEIVLPYVVIGDSDPCAWGGGNPGPAGADNGNSWMRYGRFIGGYHAPQYRPVGGFGHNDALQMYGGSGSLYWGLELRDMALWGSTNCAFQLGGWPSNGAPGNTGDVRVGPIRYSTRQKHSLILFAGLGKLVRYPVDTATTEDPSGSACNGINRPPQHYSSDCIYAGNMYATQGLTWTKVTNSRVSASPLPTTISGGFVVDTAIMNWPKSVWDNICPVPDRNRLDIIWGATPPAQKAPVIPLQGTTTIPAGTP